MITRCPSGFNSFNSHCCFFFRELRTINLFHRHWHVSNIFRSGPSGFFHQLRSSALIWETSIHFRHVTLFYVFATNVCISSFLNRRHFSSNLTEILSFFLFIREIWRSTHVFPSRFLVMKVASFPLYSFYDSRPPPVGNYFSLQTLLLQRNPSQNSYKLPDQHFLPRLTDILIELNIALFHLFENILTIYLYEYKRDFLGFDSVSSFFFYSHRFLTIIDVSSLSSCMYIYIYI